MSTESNYCFW